MNDREITKENLLFTFPVGLRENSSIAALGDVTSEALAERMQEIERLLIYPRITELPEKLLDILAYDFKVDWWDPDYGLEEKRRVFKSSWYVHKHLGTKAAVEAAIRAIYPETRVEEWFEYEGGRPYYFKLHIDLTGIKGDDVHPWRVLDRVNFYKSLRSHLDRIEFTTRPKKNEILRIGGYLSTQIRIPVPELSDNYDFRSIIRVGGAEGLATKIPLPELADSYDFRSDVRIGGTGTVTGKLPVPETADGCNFQGTVRVGGAGATMSRVPVPEDSTAPRLTGKDRTGGQPAVRFTLPVPELE